MQAFFPLILVALGGATLIIARPTGWILAALALHWSGVVWALTFVVPLNADWAAPAIELLTAVVCLAVLWSTSRSLQAHGTERQERSDDAEWERQWRGRSRSTLPSAHSQAVRGQRRGNRNDGGVQPRSRDRADQLWLIVTVLASGIAGFGLAQIYPISGSQESLLAFYWTLLAGVLILVVEAPRSHIKMAVGLILLLNSVTLLVLTAGQILPGAATLGVLAASRIALCVVVAYSWVLLKVAFREPDMTTLFNARSGVPTTALAVVESGTADTEVTRVAIEPDVDSDIIFDADAGGEAAYEAQDNTHPDSAPTEGQQGSQPPP